MDWMVFRVNDYVVVLPDTVDSRTMACNENWTILAEEKTLETALMYQTGWNSSVFSS